MSKGKILVVDDEVYIVHILDFSLGMEGYEVVTALDGEEALAKVKKEQPDLIVLDIMMPKLDGYETCRILKSDPETQQIPVILLSAKGRGRRLHNETFQPTEVSRKNKADSRST
jgi:CheY-like chemotaxis protein